MTQRVCRLLVAFFLISSHPTYADSFGARVRRSGDNATKSHEDINPAPLRAVVGTATTIGGNVIKYIGRALELVQQEGLQLLVEATADTGTCRDQDSAHKSAVFTACALRTGTSYVTIFTHQIGAQSGNVIYWVTESASDLFLEWEGAFDACSETLGEENWRFFLKPCSVVSVSLNAAGRLIRATGLSVVDTILSLTNDIKALITDLIEIPINLFLLRPTDAFWALGRAATDVGCLALDTVLLIPRFIAYLTGTRPTKSCLELTGREGK